MKTISLVSLVLFMLLASCSEEKNCDCPDTLDCSSFHIEIAYSLSYNDDSTSAEVCYADASSDIPSNSITSWQINSNASSYYGSSNCRIFTYNGDYSIVLNIITPEGLKCSATKEFSITGLK